QERFPEVLVKRRPGYGLDRYLHRGRSLTQVVCGSEGTLAAVVSAEIGLVPLPREKGLALIFFDSVEEAMEGTVNLLDLSAAAIELVDRPLLDQTKGQIAFTKTRELLRLDDAPCDAFLIVEFYDDVADRLAAVEARRLGQRTMIVTDAGEMEMVWAVRKAGLNLLTGRSGPAKPIAGLEDVAIPPQQLPEYVAALKAIMDPLGLQASFYGHAASGLLHVRPIIDLHRAEDIAKFRKVADEVSPVVLQFKGSIAAEHGVGIARTQYMADQLGPEVLDVMHSIKTAFDPRRIMNPGKIFDDGSFRIDGNLRMGDGYEIKLPFEGVLAFAAKDGSFVGNLEQCNGCGGCRKDAPTMCPTYQATGEEIMSTRGRANTIRAVLDGRLDPAGDPLASAALEEALSNCLACKACKRECPSNVDLALLKSELVHARQKRQGVSLRERAISCVDILNALACLTPRIANAMLRMRWVRAIMERVLGMSAQRPLPTYATQRFDTWFARHTNPHPVTRGRVFLWDDTFVRYNEPHVGRAAVAVLEAAGYEVLLPKGRKDSGRPSFSVGCLDRAKRLGQHNVKLFLAQGGDEPILFLEPSCYSMFVSDYAELRIDGAGEVARRCLLFDEFMNDLLEREPGAIAFEPGPARVAVHAHCHAKALTDPAVTAKLAGRLPGSETTELETGCCGMAGAFGALKSKYELSVQVAEPLVRQIEALEPGTAVVACGTSCRQQISHLTDAEPLHVAELLANALPRTGNGGAR
ncbi:MAG: 4Fe-4S dicluster domain-containing protein, partial [Candidatus Hydrogenedentes bacterium]|nr:4Fe-4S dicluster domain-containing protein [Candidatus Hydrogenedentota bacterium]